MQRIELPETKAAGVSLWVKRDDLIDAEISGNKWRKLQHYLERARFEGKTTLLTFGGAFSNHIAATAAVGKRAGFKTIGIIRGEIPEKGNPTLNLAQEYGMQLMPITREEYRLKKEPGYIAQLRERFGSFYLIPEGGAGHLGVAGCTSIAQEIESDFEALYLPVGTGTTLSGLVLSMKEHQHVVGVSSLKNGSFLRAEVNALLYSALLDDDAVEEYQSSYTIATDFAFGGYACITDELIAFMRLFYTQTQIKLDPVYTAKAMMACLHDIRSGRYSEGSNVIFLHTGGLQGIAGMEQRMGESLYPTR